MKTLMKILLLTSVFLLALFSCKKDQLELKKTADPCECASEVSADFVIEELADIIPEIIWIETDTTLHNSEVQFRALEENAEYTWYIGIEEFNTQAASRYFTDQWIGSNIPITLVVKKEPNNTCFPNDDGYDSITKTFHVSQYPIDNGDNQDVEYGTIEGTYRVFSEELNDSIDIGFDAENYGPYTSINIKNIDGLGTFCPKVSWRQVQARSYRYIGFERGGVFVATYFCAGLQGFVNNRIDGVAEIYIEPFKYQENGEIKEKSFHYFGRKLNN